MVVEPSGSCYTAHDSRSGVPRERCLTVFARNKHQERLALALDFRNAHVPVPVWCRVLDKHFGLLGKTWWTSQIRAERASWLVPSDLRYDDDEDSVAMRSRDGRCSLRIQSKRLRLSVCFPVLYAVTRTGGGDGPTYSYFLQEQHFSTRECPPQWRGLLEAVLDQLDTKPEDRSDSMVVTDLPAAESPEEAEWIPTDPSSFWDTREEVAYPRDTPVVLEWTPTCVLRFVSESDQAEILTFHDNGLMVSESAGQEFHHVRPNARGEVIRRPASGGFARSPKVHVTLDKIAKETTSIFAYYKNVVDYGANFLRHAARVKEVLAHRAYDSSTRGAPVVSNEVKAEKFSPEIGRMVAFQDGRVWIKFIDRAFLEMDHDHEHCKIYLPGGDVRVVRAHNPLGVEDYVEIAKEFAAWVHQSPNERDLQIQMHSTIMAQIEASKCMSKMIDWQLGSRDSALLL